MALVGQRQVVPEGRDLGCRQGVTTQAEAIGNASAAEFYSIGRWLALYLSEATTQLSERLVVAQDGGVSEEHIQLRWLHDTSVQQGLQPSHIRHLNGETCRL